MKATVIVLAATVAAIGLAAVAATSVVVVAERGAIAR